MIKALKYFSFLLIIIFSFSSFVIVRAQENRSYTIDLFDATLNVNKDSTINVEEDISYDFKGTYNKGWRSISHKNIGAITDIYVVDKENGKRLSYSLSRLEKTDPNNWGKYTYKVEGDFTNVEWYYNVSNEKHTWEIHYIVHGLVGFYKDKDEVYWNLFTNYEVPVNSADAKIILPSMVEPENIQFSLYRTYPERNNKQYNIDKYQDIGYIFSTAGILPNESVTIALGFPKGIVNQNSYWIDLLKVNYGWLLGFFFIL